MSIVSNQPLPSQTVELELENITIIEMILNQLRGKVYDPKTGEFRSFGTPVMNEDGIKGIGTFLINYLSKDKILTTFTENQIKNIMQEFAISLLQHLVTNYKRYEIKKEDLESIQFFIEHTVEANLNRSLGGKTLDHIQGMVNINESASREESRFPRFPLSMFSNGSNNQGGQNQNV